MLNKNTKRLVSLGISLSTISGIMPLIISSVPAYADEQGDEVQTQFNNAGDSLKGELDSYNYKADTQKEDIDSILSGFSYLTTTGSAVTIKAKECEDFSNENSTCSFKVKLYNNDDESSNELIPYSYTYNQATTGSMVSFALMSNTAEWTSSKSITNNGDTVTINGITFNLKDSGNKYVSVSGYTSDMSNDLSLPSKIDCGNIEYSVTGFENYAFMRSELTSIEIPSSVTSIAYGAFSGCTYLKSVQIPDSVTSIGLFAFDGCSSLTDINVATGNSTYKSIDGVLYSEDEKTLVKYPGGKISSGLNISNNVTTINTWAFDECTGLGAINVDSGNSTFKSIDGVLYSKDGKTLVKYPGGRIGTEFEVPSEVQNIYQYSFSYADKLEHVKISNNVTEIGWYAFQNCENLKKVEILDGLKTIGYGAFNYCSSMESMEIPTSVNQISYRAFEYCSKLSAINVDPSNLYYKSVDGVLYSYDGTKIIQYPPGKNDANYVIEGNVKTIGQGAFYGNSNLKNITIPSGVTSLEQYSFRECSGLTSIEIPNTVTTIGWGAFEICAGLTNVLIPDSVTNIGGRAFASCTGLATVFIPTNLTSISDDAFSDCDEEKLSIFKYEMSNGEITITGIHGDNIATDVIIPYSINGIKVTGVADDLFDGASDIKSITCYNPELNKTIQDLLKNEGNIAIKGISAAGYDGKYDGNYHSITIDAPAEFTLTYSTSENGVYSETNPSYKDKGSYTVYYKVSYGSDEVDHGTAAINISEDEHEFGDWMIRKDPTYTEKGERYRTCSICKEEQVEEIPMLIKTNSSSGGSSSSSSSSNDSQVEIINTEIVINNSNDEVSIIDAINSGTSNVIVINLDDFNNLNSGVFLSEKILNALKANPNKTLVIKTGNKNKTITNVEVKSTIDGQIQFTQNNILLAGFRTIANGEYYLNSSGIMETGWVQLPGETWYHFNTATGVKDKNWIRENNTWYYLDSVSGIMKTGWLNDNGSWYYLNNNGVMQTGWLKDESDKWYFLNSDGSMAIGWTNVDGKWYYLYDDGSLAVNTVIDGYSVDENGAWVY